MTMEDYYRDRAAVYDEFYQVERRKADLATLGGWVADQIRGKTVLEVAAGTGYWTAVAAPVARAITATDLHPETLSIAKQRGFGKSVTLITADAYRLPDFPRPFDVGMAMMWWSHVRTQCQKEFLKQFVDRLHVGSTILMIDQFYIEGLSNPISREDQFGNLYTVRTLAGGAKYEIIKNYPSDDDLRATFGAKCDDIVITRLGEFWALKARVKSRTS